VEYQYPRFVLDIRCASGTYIRSLGRDLAELLGSGAVMSELRRTEIGPFTAEQSIPVVDLDRPLLENSLLPAKLAVSHLPQLQLNRNLWIEIQHGRLIAVPPEFAGCAEIAAIAPSGELGAILVPRDNAIGPIRVFSLEE
jgi:tRNA pseudouridine55 synthase